MAKQPYKCTIIISDSDDCQTVNIHGRTDPEVKANAANESAAVHLYSEVIHELVSRLRDAQSVRANTET